MVPVLLLPFYRYGNWTQRCEIICSDVRANCSSDEEDTHNSIHLFARHSATLFSYMVLFNPHKNPKWDMPLLLFSHWVASDPLQPHRLQHARLPCPSLSLGVCSDSCPLSCWCCLTISSAALFSFCLQSFPASGSFPSSQLFASGGQCIRASASASVLPVNVQNWFPLGLTGLISLQS